MDTSKTLSEIAKACGVEPSVAQYVARFYKIPHVRLVGGTKMFDQARAEQVAEHIDRIVRKHDRNRKPHIVTPANESFFLAADHARWLGVNVARVEQAIEALGVIPRDEFDGQAAYRGELADAVGRVAIHLARIAGEALRPKRGIQPGGEGEPVKYTYISAAGIALWTGNTEAEVTQAIKETGVKFDHVDGPANQEMFTREDARTVAKQLAGVDQVATKAA